MKQKGFFQKRQNYKTKNRGWFQKKKNLTKVFLFFFKKKLSFVFEMTVSFMSIFAIKKDFLFMVRFLLKCVFFFACFVFHFFCLWLRLFCKGFCFVFFCNLFLHVFSQGLFSFAMFLWEESFFQKRLVFVSKGFNLFFSKEFFFFHRVSVFFQLFFSPRLGFIFWKWFWSF